MARKSRYASYYKAVAGKKKAKTSILKKLKELKRQEG